MTTKKLIKDLLDEDINKNISLSTADDKDCNKCFDIKGIEKFANEVYITFDYDWARKRDLIRELEAIDQKIKDVYSVNDDRDYFWTNRVANNIHTMITNRINELNEYKGEQYKGER